MSGTSITEMGQTLHSILQEVQTLEDQMSSELSKLKGKLSKLGDEQKSWLATASKVEKTLQASVKLNVGGMKFMTSLQTLKSQPGSFFDVMLSGKWDVKDTIFIDRDGSMFKYVLDFMRGDPLPLDLLSPLELSRLTYDADFYQLRALKTLINPIFSSTHKTLIKPTFSSTHKTLNITSENDWAFLNAVGAGHAGVLGDQEYDSGVHTFKFLIAKCGHWIFIGIGCPPMTDVHSYKHPNTYGWAGGSQVYAAGKNHQGKDGYVYNMATGDTICLTLNCSANTLSFKNETKGTPTFTLPIAAGGKWRIHVNLYDVGDKVQVISVG